MGGESYWNHLEVKVDKERRRFEPLKKFVGSHSNSSSSSYILDTSSQLFKTKIDI
jgi:hypothetical protein